MRVRLLGIAAGGGVPQWNCRCGNCRAARADSLPRATQCSLAVSPDGAQWYLVNAAPDVTDQLRRWPELHPPSGIRSTPVRGVILTDAELDHVLGLLHLREGEPWTLYATRPVAELLEQDLRVLPALRRYADVAVRVLRPDEPVSLGDGPSHMEMRLTETGRRLPRYADRTSREAAGAVVAVTLRDPATGRRLVYAPGVGALSRALFQACVDAEAVFFDGTFWTDDELRRLGVAAGGASEMGHVPVSGPEGSAEWLAKLPARVKRYVHINNTNPLLDPVSEERAAIRRLGLDVASEGWAVTL
jgi:pyrroloquinoline quinone biosynthesis protein B